MRCIDTYGRGYSEAPKVAHEPTIYALQLALLLQFIGWTKVNVIGFSMVRVLLMQLAAPSRSLNTDNNLTGRSDRGRIHFNFSPSD